jgi:hypothetical protein
VRVIYNPPWCLVDSFGHRIGEGMGVTQVGGLIVAIHENRFRVFKGYYKTPWEDIAWLQI